MEQATVGAVVNRAVELAQLDSSFLPLGRQYYNLVLSNENSSFDWPFYRVVSPDTLFVTGKLSYDLPADYNRSDTCYFVDSYGNARPIIITSKYRFDRMNSGANTVGDPRMAYIDLSNRKIVFNASDGTNNKKFRITYFRDAAIIDESGGNDSAIIDYENAQTLIYLITEMLMDYTNDDRAPAIQQKADNAVRQNKMNAYDEDNDPRIELGPCYRPGSRPTRGGSFGGFNNF